MRNATQIIILGVFIFFLVIAVIVFAVFGSGRNAPSNVPVVIWGTLPESLLPRVVETLNTATNGSAKIIYREIEANKFEDTLTSALADGSGPDVVIMPESLLYQNRKRLALISYNAYSERTFKDAFIAASEVLLTDKGSYGLPLLADPMVMYWNRDILSSAGIAKPPSTWEQVLALVPSISEVNDDKTIKRSAIAIGDYSNVTHSKEILSALMMQAGSKMVGWKSSDEAVNQISVSKIAEGNPIEDALGFFTEFVDPNKPMYSWSRALPDSLDYFTRGDLALYFGPASDEAKIRAKNPNLNFDVAILPQPGTAATKSTFTTVWSFSVLSSSKNQQASLNMIALLTGHDAAKLVSDATKLSSVRRDILSETADSAERSVFNESALFSDSWLDPLPPRTSAILATAIDAIVSGQSIVADAAKTVGKQIDEILQNMR